MRPLIKIDVSRRLQILLFCLTCLARVVFPFVSPLRSCCWMMMTCRQGRQAATLLLGQVVNNNNNNNDNVSLVLHHTAIRTRNITTAIDFYSLLGFKVQVQFRAGPARAAWLSLPSSGAARLELIQVPAYILDEPTGMRRRAPDLMENAQELGYNHMALDVTAQIRQLPQQDENKNLTTWMNRLDAASMQRFGRHLRVAVPPRQQIIGTAVYELAFIYDADGSLVEFLHLQQVLTQNMTSGWDPWDGQGFVGLDGDDANK